MHRSILRYIAYCMTPGNHINNTQGNASPTIVVTYSLQHTLLHDVISNITTVINVVQHGSIVTLWVKIDTLAHEDEQEGEMLNEQPWESCVWSFPGRKACDREMLQWAWVVKAVRQLNAHHVKTTKYYTHKILYLQNFWLSFFKILWNIIHSKCFTYTIP